MLPVTAAYAAENDKLARTPVYILEIDGVDPFSMCYAEIQRDRPNGYWRLGEPSGTMAADASLNLASGSYVGSVTHGVEGPLTADDSTGVTLAGGYISIPDNVLFDFVHQFTIEMWVKPTAIGTVQALAAKQDAGSSPADSYVLRIAASGALELVRQGSDSAVSSGVLAAGSWQHVAVSFNAYAPTKVRFYIDGEAAGSSNSIAGLFTPNSQTLLLGRSGAGDAFTGSLKDIAVYYYALLPSRLALHFAESSIAHEAKFYTHLMPDVVP